MNSSAANVNWSALLNLGGQQGTEQRPNRPNEKEQSFDKHLAQESSKVQRKDSANHVPEDASVKQVEQPDSEGVEQTQLDNGANEPKSEPAESDEFKEQNTAHADMEQEGGHAEDNSETEAAPASDQVTAELTNSENPFALVGDPAAADEVVINVPKQASVSLESVANAANAMAENPEVDADPIRTVVDQLVDGLPVDAAATSSATASTPAAANQVSSASAARPLAQSSVVPQASTTAEVTTEAADADVEGGLLPESKTNVTARSIDLQQVAENLPRPNQQTINQQLVSHTANAAGAVDAVVKDLQGAKSDAQGGGQKDAQAAIVAAQRAAARPVNVQQGSAQFVMPQQAKPGQPQWQTAVAERVAVMASQRITSAEIQLDPPELGQLQVRVTLNQEQASVSFASQHAVVRDALDQTAHKLREMFDGEGLDLVDVDVSDQSFEQQREQQEAESSAGSDGAESHQDLPAEAVVTTVSQGLVDHFV